jgi:hypothetical protein
LDTELTGRAQQYIKDLPNMWPHALEGGKGGLHIFDPTAKLYVLIHGHKSLPLFVTKGFKQGWTANQLAEQLRLDGLSLEQRDIELLVCHAGESVNTGKGAAQLAALREQNQKALQANNKSKVAELARKWEALIAKQQPPKSFEDDPEHLLLPMAAQLASALRQRKFTHFRIISYKCPVAQYSGGRHVYLDLRPKGGQWGESADDHPIYRAIWR